MLPLIDAATAKRAARHTLRAAVQVAHVAAEVARLVLPVVLVAARILLWASLAVAAFLGSILWIAFGPDPRRRRR
jgi:hypothetical protein